MVLIIGSLAQKTSKQMAGPGVRSIATLTAIFDGFGSFGASVGPLVTGIVLEDSDGKEIFYYLMSGCALMGAVVLSRQFCREVKREEGDQGCGEEGESLLGGTDVVQTEEEEEK